MYLVEGVELYLVEGVFSRGQQVYSVESMEAGSVSSRGHVVYLVEGVGLYLVEGVGCI